MVGVLGQPFREAPTLHWSLHLASRQPGDETLGVTTQRERCPSSSCTEHLADAEPLLCFMVWAPWEAGGRARLWALLLCGPG